MKTLFDETYIKDIKDRYEMRKDDDLEELVNILASGIGALLLRTLSVLGITFCSNIFVW